MCVGVRRCAMCIEVVVCGDAWGTSVLVNECMYTQSMLCHSHASRHTFNHAAHHTPLPTCTRTPTPQLHRVSRTALRATTSTTLRSHTNTTATAPSTTAHPVDASSSNTFGAPPLNTGSAALALNAVDIVSKAVSMRTLEAPSVEQSSVAVDGNFTEADLGMNGLPLKYNKEAIEVRTFGGKGYCVRGVMWRCGVCTWRLVVAEVCDGCGALAFVGMGADPKG